MADISDILDQVLSGASPAYREGRMAPSQIELARQKAARAGLENQTIQSTLDDLNRSREEQAAAPEAMARIVRGAQATPSASDVEGTSPGRPAARTSYDLLTGRGVSPEDLDVAAKWRPESLKALNLTTPEAAEQKTAEAAARSRNSGLLGQLDALDPADPDYRTKALGIITRMAAGAKPESALHGVNQMDAGQPPEGEKYDLNTGMKYVTSRDNNGKVMTRLLMMSEGDKVAAHAERMVRLAEEGKTDTPEYRASYNFVNTVRPSQLQPGAYGVPRGPLPAPGPAPSGTKPAAVGPGGPAVPQDAYRGIPPTATAAETKEAADAKTWVTQARTEAGKLEGYFNAHPGVSDRLSYAIRSSLQGKPFVGSLAILSPEENELAAKIGKLLVDWERASGGMRMASSPMMQDRIRKMLGDPVNAATPQHLRSIAEQMEQELQQRATTEAQAGRRPIAAPAAPSATPSTPQQPPVWILRDIKTQKERRYQPDPGETAPPAGYQRVR